MSSLETSVTLDDVFTVVVGKRVPLAPELAGYLALEIADGSDAGSGDVDPTTVFISEEGKVALVRPKRDAVTGDAEASVRKLLARLLDASGSGTPALSTAAKRKPGNGLPALVEELEAALIPVNRAAGRRALARIAREVKRVTLGVGRNAPPASTKEPRTSGAPGQAKAKSAAAPHARPPIRKRSDDQIPKAKVETASRSPSGIAADLASLSDALPLPPSRKFEDEAATARRSNEIDELLGISDIVPPPDSEPSSSGLRLPPPAAGRPLGPPPKREPAPPPPVPEAIAVMVQPPTLFGGDEVDSLLDTFGVSGIAEDKQVSRDLKAIAGLEPTPPPPDARTLAELIDDVGKDLPTSRDSSLDGDSVEALLALADASGPVPAARDDEPGPTVTPPPLPELGPSSSQRAPAPISSPRLPATPPSSPALPPPSANLPPSPLFGAGGAVDAGMTPGAPAALRQSSENVPAHGAAAESVRGRPASPPRHRGGKGDPPTGPQAVAPQTKRTRREKRRAPRTGMAMLVFALVVLAGGTAAIWKYAPQVFTGHKKPVAPPAVATIPAPPPPLKCKVALVLTDVPPSAEILLRMGQAPMDVERMPVGTRLEFVATAEGHAPKRAVIRAETTWDKGPDGKPRIDAPIQLEPTKAKPTGVDPWPAAEPGSQVGGSGAPGTVHVISNIRGAEVWLLAGLGPEARIDQLRCDADIDVLVAGTPGQPSLRKRLHISDKEITAAAPDIQGSKVINLSGK